MMVVVDVMMMVRFRFAARHSFIHSVVGWLVQCRGYWSMKIVMGLVLVIVVLVLIIA